MESGWLRCCWGAPSSRYARRTPGAGWMGAAPPYARGPLFPPDTKFRYWDDAMMQFGNVLTHLAGEPLDERSGDRSPIPSG